MRSARFRGAVAAVAVLLFCSILPHARRISAPGLILWAWERPEDLGFVAPVSTGVAYLAATVNLEESGRARFHFRQQPLVVPPGTATLAVVRIETPPHYVFPDGDELVSGIAALTAQRKLAALQIDFDARASERALYGRFLEKLQRRVSVPVGITALASWCEEDAWFGPDLVSEAVPMFFRMGPGESKTMPVSAPGCRSSLGVSTDEAWPPRHLSGLRVYVFDPHPWTERDYAGVVRKVRLMK